MAEVGDGGDPKSALGALDEELVLVLHGEHGAQVAEVVGPGGAVDQNIIKKQKHEPAEEWTQHVVHERLERCRALHNSKWQWVPETRVPDGFYPIRTRVWNGFCTRGYVVG